MQIDKDVLLDALLKAIDTKIDAEKGERGEAGENSPEWHYANGRVDGVDAARYIVEQVITEFAGQAGAMTLEVAKQINADTVNIALAFQGIGSAGADAVSRFKECDLDELVQAARMMDGYSEDLPEGGKRMSISCTPPVIADTYLRIHSGLVDLGDLQELCEAVSEAKDSEYGILLDGRSNITLLELNHDGDGGVSVVYETDFPAFEAAAVEFINYNS